MSEYNQESKDRFSNIVKESLQEEMSSAETTKEKGDMFLIWAVSRLIDASKDEIREQITDGKDDMGIDAWIKPEIATENGGGTIQLFQSKYGSSHDDKEILKFENQIKIFLTCPLEKIPRDDMKKLRITIDKEKLEPELYYVTDQTIKNKIEINKIKIMGFEDIVDKLWADMEGVPEGITEILQLEDHFERNDCIVGAVSLKNFRKFVSKTQSYIYESNIRKYLQKTKINKGLKKTLIEEIDAVFHYNNGITIVVKDYIKNDSGFTLIEPQIVNGAQTSQTVFETLPLITNADGEITVTIIKETGKIIKSQITKFRNSQNAVKGKDLITLEQYHKLIAVQLKQIGYFYQRQAGSWRFLKDRGDKKYDGHDTFRNYLPSNHENFIPSPESIQAMVSGIFQNPTKPYASQASYMPNGSKYQDIFNRKLPENYRFLFYSYLVRSYGEKLEYGSKDAQPPLKRYSRLLFVCAYFFILFETMKIKLNDLQKNPEILDKYFKNHEVNVELLKFTDEAMENYFFNAQTYYDDLNKSDDKNITWHTFFGTYAWDPELQTRMKSFLKIRREKLTNITDKF